MALDRWAYTKDVTLAFIRPGKPVENAFIESFNGRIRQECLTRHYVPDLEDARKTLEQRRMRYNDLRPHRSLNGMTPEGFAQQWRAKHDVNNTLKLSQEPVQTKGEGH